MNRADFSIEAGPKIGGSWVPSNTMLPGPRPTSSWSVQLFDHNRHGPKSGEGCCAPFLGETGPHRTQCHLSWGLPSYQVASWSIRPFGHNRYRPKLWELGPHRTQCGHGRSLPPCQVASWSIQPFGHNTPTSQTDSGPIGYGEPFYKRSPKNKMSGWCSLMLQIPLNILMLLIGQQEGYDPDYLVSAAVIPKMCKFAEEAST